MPRKAKSPKPLYRQKPPAKPPATETDDFVHATPIAPAHFKLREDGSIQVGRDGVSPSPIKTESPGQRHPAPPSLTFSDPDRSLWLYHGNRLELLDAIYAKYGNAGRFDAIFADPPYFLSNGGISCHAGKMVKVDKAG